MIHYSSLARHLCFILKHFCFEIICTRSIIATMKKQLVFIDDSGDPGFKEGASSSTFVMAGAIFIDSKNATLLNNAISRYRQKLGWKDEHEFKSFIRRELRGSKKIGDFDTQDSVHDNLIQLADMVVGSINRSLQTEKTDSKEYIHIIKNRIINIKQLNLGKE